MKNLFLCSGLFVATAGGVVFVVANQPPPVPVEAAVRQADPATEPTGDCPRCQTGGVYDVTDLSARFAARCDTSEFVSFDEPPLAKPKGEEPREVLPPPREVKD